VLFLYKTRAVVKRIVNYFKTADFVASLTAEEVATLMIPETVAEGVTETEGVTKIVGVNV
jgi:hypothetical protein